MLNTVFLQAIRDSLNYFGSVDKKGSKSKSPSFEKIDINTYLIPIFKYCPPPNYV